MKEAESKAANDDDALAANDDGAPARPNAAVLSAAAPPLPPRTTPEAPAASAPAPKSPVQRLKERKEAFEGGLISEEAMEKKRDEILAAM